MQTEVTDLIEGWAAPRPLGPVADSAVEHQVDSVVAADGWSSVMRELAATERENEIIELESHRPDVFRLGGHDVGYHDSSCSC